MIRRIALEKNGINLNEYARNLLAENIPDLPEMDSGKRNLVELIELAHSYASNSDAALEQAFPDLTNEDIDLSEAIGMYRRFAVEATDVLGRYSGAAALMSAT